MSDWYTCEHEWENHPDSMWDNETFQEVYCVKCECPGEKTIKTGEVYWPAT